MKKIINFFVDFFVWIWKGFASVKPYYKFLIFLSFVVVTVCVLNVFNVINMDTLIFGEKKAVSFAEQQKRDSLYTVDSIKQVQAQIAKAKQKAEADSFAAQEARKVLSAPIVSKKRAQPITLATVFNDSIFWPVAMVLLLGVIITVFYISKKPTGFMNGVFASSGKFMMYGGVLYFICFAFYMRNQTVQKIPFYADESRIRWVIDSTAMANPKQVVYAPDPRVDSLIKELDLYRRQNILLQDSQQKMIDSLLAITNEEKETLVISEQSTPKKDPPKISGPFKKRSSVARKRPMRLSEVL